MVAVSYILLNMSSISYSGYFTFHIWIQSLADISDTIPKFRPKTHHTIRSHLTNTGKWWNIYNLQFLEHNFFAERTKIVWAESVPIKAFLDFSVQYAFIRSFKLFVRSIKVDIRHQERTIEGRQTYTASNGYTWR